MKKKKPVKGVAKVKKPVRKIRKVKRVVVRPKAKATARKPVPAAGKPIGRVTHFYNEIGVAIVKFNRKVPVGATLYFKGATTDFKETVKSMQYDHQPIVAAPKGKLIGIKVKKRVREGDETYLANG